MPSPSKPFFSLRHVQRVDKRHHPTDSLINCEMYSYLPLSCSHAPKNPLLPASSASPLLPVSKEKKQTGLHKESFSKKRKKEKIKLLSLQISCFKTFYPFPVIPTRTQPWVPMHAFTHSKKCEQALC